MGQALSIHDLRAHPPPKTEVQIVPSTEKSQSHQKGISRSNSCHSLSQISYQSTASNTDTSMISTVSNVTVSLSEKFVSYEDTMIHIPPRSPSSNSKSRNNLRWNLRTFPKYNEHMLDLYNDDNEVNDSKLCIVFGICDAALLEKGYKHKYYGYGYSVTYCHNIKFQSFATTFDRNCDIWIQYDAYNGELSFWSDGVMKKRRIRISSTVQNIITVKCYNDSYDIRICS